MKRLVSRGALFAFLSLYFFSCGGGGGSSAPGTPTAPAAPTGVTATPGNGKATIAWTAVSGATSYNVYWSTTEGVTPANGTQMTDVASPYDKTGLTNGTPHYFVVTAVNAVGESAASSQAGATPVAPVPTAVGTPTGVAVTKTIGAAGGSLSLAWTTTVTVTIPAGALAADTLVGIESITNESPGGLGGAFRLTPEGASFSAPVQITFSYTDDDLKGSALEALGVAYQDADGFWRALKGAEVTRDEVAKTLTVSTTHFSDWSRLIGWQIRPAEATIKAGASITLTVMNCEPVDDGDVATLLSQCTSDEVLSPFVSGWAVNGTPGGSMGVGFVTGGGNAAVYQAPLGTQDTYAVSVRLDTLAVGKTQLVSNITVSDEAPRQYVGTTTYVDNHHNTTYVLTHDASMEVKVTFDRDMTAIGYLQYLPTGTYTGTITYYEVDFFGDLEYSSNTSCAGTIGPEDGLMQVNLTADPPMWAMVGGFGTGTCTETTFSQELGTSVTTYEDFAPWVFLPFGSILADGTIDGSIIEDESTDTSSSHFATTVHLVPKP